MGCKTEILTTEELNLLKRELRSNYFAGIVLFFMAYFLIHLLYYASSQKWLLPGFELFVFCGGLFAALFLVFMLSRKLRKEINGGLKVIDYKLIEDKYSFNDRMGRISAEFTKYVVIAGGNRFVVAGELYERSEISDFLLVHKTTERERELKLELKKK